MNIVKYAVLFPFKDDSNAMSGLVIAIESSLFLTISISYLESNA